MLVVLVLCSSFVPGTGYKSITIEEGKVGQNFFSGAMVSNTRPSSSWWHTPPVSRPGQHWVRKGFFGLWAQEVNQWETRTQKDLYPKEDIWVYDNRLMKISIPKESIVLTNYFGYNGAVAKHMPKLIEEASVRRSYDAMFSNVSKVKASVSNNLKETERLLKLCGQQNASRNGQELSNQLATLNAQHLLLESDLSKLETDMKKRILEIRSNPSLVDESAVLMTQEEGDAYCVDLFTRK